jgi:hypothetical protein
MECKWFTKLQGRIDNLSKAELHRHSETHFTYKNYFSIPSYKLCHTTHLDGAAHGGTAIFHSAVCLTTGPKPLPKNSSMKCKWFTKPQRRIDNLSKTELHRHSTNQRNTFHIQKLLLHTKLQIMPHYPSWRSSTRRHSNF